MTERKWLLVCAALASGEALASLAPNFAEAWPAAAFAALAIAVWGFSFSLPGWRLACVFALGIAVFLHSEVEKEQQLRDRPWMRKILSQRKSYAGKSRLAFEFRRDLSQRMGIGLGHSPETANMNRAILLGERYRLRKEDRNVFVESGTVHVFAISGLHVMIVAKVFVILASLMLVPYRFLSLVAAPALWFYVWIIGFPPSAVRAALMATLYFAAPLFWRKPNMVVAWSLTFLGMHIAVPALIADVGCQLSFAVMLAIALAARRVRNCSQLKQRLSVAFAAWAAGVPIVACTFGTLTPGGLLANLILVPAAEIAVIACVVGVALSWVCKTLASHVNNLASLVTSAMAGVSTVVSKLPGANFEIDKWGIGECLSWYAIFFVFPYFIYKMMPKKLF